LILILPATSVFADKRNDYSVLSLIPILFAEWMIWGAKLNQGLTRNRKPFFNYKKFNFQPYFQPSREIKKPAEAGCIIIVMLFVILRKPARVTGVQPIAPIPCPDFM
jgi:hypothetical protein